jgi:hypothetical protein
MKKIFLPIDLKTMYAIPTITTKNNKSLNSILSSLVRLQSATNRKDNALTQSQDNFLFLKLVAPPDAVIFTGSAHPKKLR